MRMYIIIEVLGMIPKIIEKETRSYELRWLDNKILKSAWLLKGLLEIWTGF